MKLEKFIIQDGAAYEFTGEYKAPLDGDYYFSATKEAKIRQWNGGPTKYSRPIYKLIAPAVKKYDKEGDAYKFTGRIGTAKTHEYFYNEKGQMISGAFPQNAERPIYTLLAQKHTEGTKFQKGNDDGAGRPQGEGSKLYFYTTDIPIDPSKPTSFKTMKGMSELQEKLKKEFSDPPPFIKQGEDYFLYVKTDVVQKGDWFYSTNGYMIQQALNGVMNIKRSIYEKLPLTHIQDGVLYVFTGEYREVSKDEYYYRHTGITKWGALLQCNSEGLYPIYITFEDYYWKQYPAMDAAGKEWLKFIKDKGVFPKTPIDKLFEWTQQIHEPLWRSIHENSGSMSGVAIQKLQGAEARLSNTQLLILFGTWLERNPLLNYKNVKNTKLAVQVFKGHTSVNAQILDIMIAIIYNGADYFKEDARDYTIGCFSGINHRYQKKMSFEELKALNLQFQVYGDLFTSDEGSFLSILNYKILE